MDKLKSEIKDSISEITLFSGTFAKWVGISILIGAIGGLIGSAFNLSVSESNMLRAQYPWLLYLLPIGGVAIAVFYSITHTEKEGTNGIIDSILYGRNVPIILIPVIFLSTVITHLFGGSAGREGAALQIGGSLGCGIGKLFHLDEKEERIAILSGMSAVFSALFGTPVTASVFALEVCSIGIIHYSGLVPCGISAITAYGITRLFEIAPTRFTIQALGVEPVMLVRVCVLAIGCAVLSIVFCQLMHAGMHYIKKAVPSPYLRALIGGTAIIILTLLFKTTDYNGGGIDVIARAIEEGSAKPEAFLLKMLFTVITLSCGFRGGEIVPTFFIGATFGAVVGPLLGIPAGFAAAVGMAATFCGAVNCPVASVFLSIEVFGSGAMVYFAAACFISYMLSGYTSLYKEQKIIYSKLKAEYINKQAD